MHRQLCTGHSQMVIQCLVVTLPAADTSYQMGQMLDKGHRTSCLIHLDCSLTIYCNDLVQGHLDKRDYAQSLIFVSWLWTVAESLIP